MKRGVIVIFYLLFMLYFVSAAAVENSIPIQIQTVDTSGNIITGTFEFKIDISNSASCAPVLYTNTSTRTTDSRGIVSYNLENVNLSFDEQYWFCYYRDGVLKDTVKAARVPYTFRAKNVTLSGIEVSSNFDMSGYNITASIGNFGVQVSSYALNVMGNVNITGNVSIGGNYLCNATDCFSFADLREAISGETVGGYFNQQLNTTSSPTFVNGTFTGYVGIGTANPETVLDVFSTAGNLALRSTGTNTLGDVSGGLFQGVTNNTPTASGQRLGGIILGGIRAVGSTYVYPARIQAFSDEAWSVTANGAYLSFYTTDNATTTLDERMRITSSGNVGIGISSPTNKLQVVDTTETQLRLSQLGVGSWDIGVINEDALGFFDQSIAEPYMVIATAGKVGIGTTSPTSTLTVDSITGVSPAILVEGSTNTERIGIRSVGGAGGGTPVMGVFSGRGTIASPTASQSGDNIGYYQLGGYDGAGYWRSSWITGTTEENWNSTNKGSNMIFSTTPNASTTITERMRITQGGNVGIGTTTPSQKLEVNGVINATGGIATGSVVLKTKVINISDWNMDITASKDVTHGLTKENIRSVFVLVQEDSDTVNKWRYPLDYSTGAAYPAGNFAVKDTVIALTRVTSGVFDNTGFDMTSFNRGWVTITYEA